MMVVLAVAVKATIIPEASMISEMGVAEIMVRRFKADIMMRPERDAVTAQTLHDEPAVVEAITIQNHAAAEHPLRAVMRNEKPAQIVVPKMIVSDKHERVERKAKIEVHAHATAKFKAHTRAEHSPRWQRRPAHVTIRLTPCDPRRRPI